MERKRLEINPATLYVLLGYGNNECDGFEIVENKITSSDPEDGGAEHDYVIKEVSTGNFYGGRYSDWDIENTGYNVDDHTCDGEIDLDFYLIQVFPEKVEITQYK